MTQRFSLIAALLSLSCLIAVAVPAQAQVFDLSTPAKAWATLDAAYRRNDLDAIISAHDYETEALMILNGFFPEWKKAENKQKDIDPVAEMVKMMIAKVRSEGHDNTGFPLRGNTLCRITEERQFKADIVELQLQCLWEKGSKVSPKLHFKQTGGQWRLFDVVWK